MKTWVDLYRNHTKLRANVDLSWTSEVRKRLIALADAGHCDSTIRGRFSNQNCAGLMEWSIRRDGAQVDEPLSGLSTLKSAAISVLALSNRSGHLHSFTIAVEGKRHDDSDWALAVHLPDDRISDKTPNGDREGLGACGHAALHCHVGPDLDTTPKVRVPMPPLGPVEVLEWVISQVTAIETFEPAPWPSVVDAMEKRQ